MTIFILAYFCKLLIEVVEYGDPQISSYEIMEDRSNMETALRLSDMHTNFVFGFMDKFLKPVELDPKIGKFELFQDGYTTDDEGNITMIEKDVGVKSTTLDNDGDEKKWGTMYSVRGLGGIYTAEDFNSL